MKKELEVGDELVPFIAGFLVNRTYRPSITIERLTAKQAISGKYKFKRELSYTYGDKDSLHAVGIGATASISTTFYLRTPQLEIEMAEIDAARELSMRVSRLEDKLNRKLLAKFSKEDLDIVEAIADKYEG